MSLLGVTFVPCDGVIGVTSSNDDESPVVSALSSGWAHEAGTDAHGHWADFEINGIRQRMRWIPSGTFMMGSPRDEEGRHYDESQHEVKIANGFWLADTPCTQELWEAVTGNNPSRFRGNRRPVERVSWDDVQEFLAEVGKLGIDIRLPTEEEWEYACRAGSKTAFSFGDNISSNDANFDGHTPYNGVLSGRYRRETVEVKGMAVNKWGLYEMHGNVREWCSDWYAPYDNTPSKSCSYRVQRGGSWSDEPLYLRSAHRQLDSPSSACDFVGFRFAQDA